LWEIFTEIPEYFQVETLGTVSNIELADEDDFIGSDYCRARGFNVL
jgi:hypothetical protein